MAKRPPPRILTREEVDKLFAEGAKVNCYWRPRRHKAESIYPAIEFGYLVLDYDQEDLFVAAKYVVADRADGIWMLDSHSWYEDPNYAIHRGLSFDRTRDGYWRIIGSGWRWDPLWEYGTAKLMHGPKEVKDD